MYKIMILGLLFGWTVSAIAADFAAIKSLAEIGDIASQLAIAKMYKNGEEISQDDQQAFEWFEKAANQGYPLAQANLGVMYYEGSGVKQNYMLAKKWFEAAAKQGDAEAQGILGLFYEYGLGGVSQNYAQAKAWYGKSCMNGNQNGCSDYQKLN